MNLLYRNKQRKEGQNVKMSLTKTEKIMVAFCVEAGMSKRDIKRKIIKLRLGR